MGLLPFVLAAAVVSGPITGGDRGQPFSAMPAADLTQAAYTEAEYFLAGTAASYKPASPPGIDGMWQAAPDTTADYKIRMLVRRPADARAFNGIVVVEWLNVTANAEGAADFMQMQEELLRRGYAWVGVGAQTAGVNSPRSGLKDWDKTRYGSLAHPGDAYSYDIFTQSAGALRRPGGVNPLGGLAIRKMIATGRSQSACRLVTYINAVHALAPGTFDGYLVHSRGANASGFKAEGLARDADNAVPPGAHIRTDIDVPVLDLQTEGDMAALDGSANAMAQESAPGGPGQQGGSAEHHGPYNTPAQEALPCPVALPLRVPPPSSPRLRHSPSRPRPGQPRARTSRR